MKKSQASKCCGCGKCCGIVPVNTQQFNAIVRYAKKHGIVPVKQGIVCPFRQGGKCVIYEVRPYICKLFGHALNLTCPNGGKFSIIPPGRAKREFAQESVAGRKYGVMYLHEACYTGEEINAILKGELDKSKAAEK